MTSDAAKRSGHVAYRRYWTWERENSKGWNGAFCFGRLKLRLTVIRHGGHLPDRWVIQPHIVYDRSR